MEDAIEICSGCGKMPRSIDTVEGRFVCTRCGNNQTIQVKSDDYEKTAMELDSKFHANVLKQKLASVSKEPIVKASKPRAKSRVTKKKPAKKAKRSKK
jgi:hypothetical protein